MIDKEQTVGGFLENTIGVYLPENNLLWLLRHVPLNKLVSDEKKIKNDKKVIEVILDMLDSIGGNGEVEELIEGINNPEEEIEEEVE